MQTTKHIYFLKQLVSNMKKSHIFKWNKPRLFTIEVVTFVL